MFVLAVILCAITHNSHGLRTNCWAVSLCTPKGNKMNLKQELQDLNNRLDKCRNKLAAAKSRNDQPVVNQFKNEVAKLEKQRDSIKGTQSRQANDKGNDIKSMSFNRALTKAEQADMGKLKKSVKGLVVVHPMTAIGREMKIKEVTGFAHKPF